MPYKNIEDKRRQSREWARQHPQDKKERYEYCKKWRAENPERVKAWKKTYSKKHAEYINEKSKLYYWNVKKDVIKANPEKFREISKKYNDIKYQKRKEILYQLRVEMGGKCAHCGYSEEIRILQFHHNSGKKESDVSCVQSLPKIAEEAKKCILLCPNCHAIETLKKYNENI